MWLLYTGLKIFWARKRLVVVDNWPLFRGNYSNKIAWVGFRVVIVDRWLLFGGGH